MYTYKIWDRHDYCYLDKNEYILTQDGKVANWSEWEGWEVEEEQCRFEIVMYKNGEEVK